MEKIFVTLAFLLVLLSALGGWCIAYLFIKILFKPYVSKKITRFTVQGIVPFVLNNQSHLIAAAIRQEFLSEKLLQQVLDNPELLQQMAPAIEAHVDLFLNEKLSEAFPLLYKFMGEKTLQKFKDTFLQEVETILPNMLQQYGTMLLQSNKIEESIADQIRKLSAPQLEASLHRFAHRYFRCFKIVATLLGTLIGVLQTVIVYLLIFG